jgi:putative ABC transport system permease protein
MGVAGTAIGIGAGYLLAAGVLNVLQQVVKGVQIPELRWTTDSFLLALVVGPGMALAATWLPARLAARRAPLEDLLSREGVHRDETQRWLAYCGLALICLHACCAVGLLRGWLPQSLLASITPIGIVGCVLATPLVIRPLLSMAGILLQWPLGWAGVLASRQLGRRPTRTSLTVSILSIAIFVSISVGHAVISSVRDTRDWSMRLAVADYYVSAAIPGGGFASGAAALPEPLENDLSQIEGVERVDKANWLPSRANGQRIIVRAYTVRADRPPVLDVAQGDLSNIVDALLNGEVVVGVPLGERLGVGAGDEIVLDTPAGPKRLHVAGTAHEHTISNLSLHMEWNTAKRLFKMEGVHLFDVTAQPGKAAVAGDNLRSFCQDKHLVIQSRAEMRSYIDQAVTRIIGLVWALFALVFIVASLAVVNTLTMNVLEQTRELGILRAVGLRRRLIRRLVLAHALTIAVVSLVPGTIIGLGLAYVLNMVSRRLFAQAVAFQIDFFLVASCWTVVTVVTVIAALLPGRRAARLRVVQALQYE